MKRIVLAAIAAVCLLFPIDVLAQASKPAPPRQLPPHAQVRLSTKSNATLPVGTNIGLDVAWLYTANLSPCVNGVLQDCQSGFTLTITEPGGTVATVGPGLVGGIGPSALTYTWEPGGEIPYGTYSLSLVANGYGTPDQNGNVPVLTSAPATGSVTVTVASLNAPMGVTGAPVTQ